MKNQSIVVPMIIKPFMEGFISSFSLFMIISGQIKQIIAPFITIQTKKVIIDSMENFMLISNKRGESEQRNSLYVFFDFFCVLDNTNNYPE